MTNFSVSTPAQIQLDFTKTDPPRLRTSMDQFAEMSTLEAEHDRPSTSNVCPDNTSPSPKRFGDEEANLGNFHRLRNCSKSHSTPATLKWLEENYEIAEAVCIPRSTLYCHYLDYCETNDTQPVNAASFGKIIRQQFPQITTRRLGTRGQSKYHYYGIGVRETSKYFETVYSAKGTPSSNEGKKENVKQIVAYSPRSKLGTLLPDFPDIKDIKLPDDVPEDKVLTFMMMYRTHCQRILDTVIRANFDEVQSFLLHFWQGMPEHMMTILDSQTTVLLVGVCDTMLYKAIANVLMPSVLQALPDSLIQVIKNFSQQLDEWLKIALDSLPIGIREVKFDLARRFSQILRRQISLNHLCQAARSVVHNPDISAQMLEDWISVDLSGIIKQTMYTMERYREKVMETIVNLCNEFEQLLDDQAPLQSYTEWLDRMVDRCVVQFAKNRPGSLRRTARQFLLMWSCFCTRIIRDMTLHSSPSFGSFHLLHLMFDDYVLFLVENLYSQERSKDFLRHIKGEITDLTDDEPLPDYSVLKEAFIAAEAKAASNTITKTSEGLKVDIFKENIGIEREVISPRTRFIDPSQDFECTHPIVLNPHSSFLKHVRPTFESTFPYGSHCHTANTQTTTTQSNNTTSNNSCLNQDQSTEMTRQGAFFMELQGTSLSDNSNFTQQNEEFPFHHYLRNQQPLRGSINQTVERVAINPEVVSNYGYTTGYCYDYHPPYLSKQKLQDC
ncbi:transcription factor RFX4-like isoform X2 [Crassostrea angulata]|uniref:transcription factor RFX4-like isoform X2 n=1 Tax=Magallana angulata TaxID=2784310 RepID=UPI0022B16F04|nr:transcription factor RFX4-like isoform X2 [Crassostrea angulata]